MGITILYNQKCNIMSGEEIVPSTFRHIVYQTRLHIKDSHTFCRGNVQHGVAFQQDEHLIGLLVAFNLCRFLQIHYWFPIEQSDHPAIAKDQRPVALFGPLIDFDSLHYRITPLLVTTCPANLFSVLPSVVGESFTWGGRTRREHSTRRHHNRAQLH